MTLFLYGRDSYRSRQKLREIIGHYQKAHKNGLSLKYFDGSDLDLKDLKNELQITPMFKEKKIIILKNIFSDPKKEEDFLEIFKKLKDSEDIILICGDGKTNKSNPLFKFLKKHGKSEEFEPLDGQALKNWAKAEFANYGARPEGEALAKIVELVGNDLWRLSNEIKKLVNYGKGKNITVKDVEFLVRPKIEPDIFKTIDAIASQNKKQAFRLLRGHIEKGDSPLYLLSMINFQLRNLLVVKDLIEKRKPFYSLAKTTGLHPYVVKKSYFQAQKFTFQGLKKIYRKIFQADASIKTGRVSPETALDLFIAEI